MEIGLYQAWYMAFGPMLRVAQGARFLELEQSRFRMHMCHWRGSARVKFKADSDSVSTRVTLIRREKKSIEHQNKSKEFPVGLRRPTRTGRACAASVHSRLLSTEVHMYTYNFGRKLFISQCSSCSKKLLRSIIVSSASGSNPTLNCQGKL